MHTQPAHSGLTRFLRLSRSAIAAVVGALVIAACNGAANVQKDTAAQNLLPNMPGYTVANVVDLQKAVSDTAAGASALTGNLPLAGVLKLVNEVSTCYQNAGAVEGRTYVNNANPLLSGVVFIVNRNALTSPANFLQCVLPSTAQGIDETFSPCAYTYTLPKDGNEFYIAFAATNRQVCQQFCSGLQGCGPREF